MKPTVAELNAADITRFVAVCGPLFEHSPWIAERAAAARPFGDRESLFQALCAEVKAATDEGQLALVRAHPDLVGRAAGAGQLTDESTREQAAAGLGTLSIDDVRRFQAYNAAYHARFGFPFIICARENKKQSILAAFPVRLQNSRDQELRTAVEEIFKIARLRLLDAVAEE